MNCFMLFYCLFMIIISCACVSYLTAYIFLQEDINLHLQDKENQADIVCCMHHLQVLDSKLVSFALYLSNLS